MINPFVSNNDQFLFRKNYQTLHKPTPEQQPLPSLDNSSQLNYLQYNNPFRCTSPKIPIRNTSVTSPQRPNSLSRGKINTSAHPFAPRGGLLDLADGWKRDMQYRERQKLQIYGAEGLRYNAYIYDEAGGRPNTEQDYYQIYKPTEGKLPTSRIGHYDSSSSYYMSPTTNLMPAAKKHTREHFQDEVFQSPNFNVIDPRKKESNSWKSEQSPHQGDMFNSKGSSKHSKGNDMFNSRQSKIQDMFQSQYDQKMKKSMQHGSYYGGYVQEEMLHSKSRGSRFREDKSGSKLPRGYSEQSSVHEVSLGPGAINLWGKVYHRIHL